MTTKVVVTGSYREQESIYDFTLGQQDCFERTAKNIGRKLAIEGYTLLVSWSEANPESQLDTRRINQPNYPYVQTADFHALSGYLEAIQQSPELITNGAKVKMTIAGTRDRFSRPFNQEIDFYKGIKGVEVIEEIGPGHPKYRSQLLCDQALVADVFIIIGGGKATNQALLEATRRQVLLPLGFVGGIGKKAIAYLSANIKEKLIAEVGDLDNLKNVDMITAKLPTLINIITSQSISPTQSPTEPPIMPSFPPDNEPPAPSTQRQPPNDFRSFLDNSRTEHPVIFLLCATGIIIGLIVLVARGIIEFSVGEVTVKRFQPSPTTSASPQPSETKNTDNFQVTVNYRCLWKSPGKNSQPVDKATVKTFINGDANSSSDTNSNGYVSFKMKSTDEVKAEITHLDARDVPIKDDVKLTSTELESKKITIDRQSCLLWAK